MGSDFDEFEFRGTGAEECYSFIHYIRGKIHQEGKRGDDQWIMELVSTCLAGGTIAWESSLDPEIASNWTRFQKALLERYANPDSNPGLSGIPTPAAAPPPRPSSRLCTSSPLALDATHRVGWIRIIAKDPSGGTFVSRKLDGLGRLLGCMDRKDALFVRFIPSVEPHAIEMLNPPDALQYLGAHQYGAEKPEKASLGYAFVVTTDSGHTQSSFKGASHGPVRSCIWTVSSDMTVKPIWEAGEPPLTAMCISSKQILLCGDPEKRSGWTAARLAFEPADKV